MNSTENLKASVTWFHLGKAIFDEGIVAKMGSHAFTTYCTIKSHIDFKTGAAFPSVDMIAAKSGLSERQVIRELKTLEENGYLLKERQGRANRYVLRENVTIENTKGPVAKASWDYVPNGFVDALDELKRVLITGNFADTKIILIEHLYLNVANANDGGTATIINGQKSVDKKLKTG